MCLRLNRQPGRRVDVAISGAGDLGLVDLDYPVVAQSRKPWYIYAQASNTGTKETNPCGVSGLVLRPIS